MSERAAGEPRSARTRSDADPAAAFAAFEVTPERFAEGRPMLVAGLRRRHAFAEAAAGIAEQWREFLGRESPSARRNSTLLGVMCGSDPGGFEYMCGAEVEAFDGLDPSHDRIRIPAQQYAVFAPAPGRIPREAIWPSILRWLETGPYRSAHRPDYEAYAEGADPLDPGARLEVWVGVVPAVDGG